jgi:hypothetical protein
LNALRNALARLITLTLRASSKATVQNKKTQSESHPSSNTQEILFPSQKSKKSDSLLKKARSPLPFSFLQGEGARRADEVLDGACSTDEIGECARRADEVLKGARSTDEVLEGARSTDEVLEGARSTNEVLEGVRSTDEVLDGARKTDEFGESPCVRFCKPKLSSSTSTTLLRNLPHPKSILRSHLFLHI